MDDCTEKRTRVSFSPTLQRCLVLDSLVRYLTICISYNVVSPSHFCSERFVRICFTRCVSYRSIMIIANKSTVTTARNFRRPLFINTTPGVFFRSRIRCFSLPSGLELVQFAPPLHVDVMYVCVCLVNFNRISHSKCDRVWHPNNDIVSNGPRQSRPANANKRNDGDGRMRDSILPTGALLSAQTQWMGICLPDLYM